MKKISVLILSLIISCILSSCYSDESKELLTSPSTDKASVASTMAMLDAFDTAKITGEKATTYSRSKTLDKSSSATAYVFTYNNSPTLSVNGYWSVTGDVKEYNITFDFNSYNYSYTDENSNTVNIKLTGSVSAIITYDTSTSIYSMDLTSASPVVLTYGTTIYTIGLDISSTIKKVPIDITINGIVTLNGTGFIVSYNYSR